MPVPDETPAARVRHSTRGEPLRLFTYRNANDELLGYQARFLTSTGEPLHLPLTWCKNDEGIRGWRWIQFPRLRPLYGLDKLAQRPADDAGVVVVVFDENEAEAARKLLPDHFCVVSWPGGIRKIDEVDWSPLKNCTIWIWPTKTADRAKVRRDDAEGGAVLPRDGQSGWKAALKIERVLRSLGCHIFGVQNPWGDASVPEGFGPAMAESLGWDAMRLMEWMLDGSHANAGVGTEYEQLRRRLRGEKADADPPEGVPYAVPLEHWEQRLMRKHGEVAATLANVNDMLLNRDEWRGVIAFDEFAQRVVKLKPAPYGGKAGEWLGLDDTEVAMWLSRRYNFAPTSALVAEAVEVIARRNGFHPVRDYLRKQKWDGVERLKDWAADY
ncbi:MAG: hypothetical protein LBG66_01750, partial [Gallionellaceae bacterium]|nr:hypothetical protein [Gallionellaceae bacterium]